jgi:hydroxymethylbilane synthase
VRIGTRGSALARAQAEQAAAAVSREGLPVSIVTIETAGDRRASDTPWGEGAFVGAIEQALLDGDIDLAVHSAKDMPTAADERLRIVGYLPRADPRDALVLPAGGGVATLDALPAGATIGTDSPRRTGFLRARRADLRVVPLHGNVDTRLRRLDEGAVDALVLAVAGLERLGRADRISHRFAADELPSAPGQGAIALQARAGDERLARAGRALDHPATRAAVETERHFLAATGGGCRAPIGAMATVHSGSLRLLGGFATIDGRTSAVEVVEGPLDAGPALAAALATRLVASRAAAGTHGRVLVTRAGHQSDRLSGRLAEYGLSAVVVPAIEIQVVTDERPLVAAVERLGRFEWVVVTSANGARAALDAAAHAGVDPAAGRWATVGSATAEVLASAGVPTAWLPSRPLAAALGDELPIAAGARVLLLRGSLADEALPVHLRGRGALVEEAVAYETVEAPPSSRQLLAAAFAGDPPVAVVFGSPSAVRGLLALADADLRPTLLRLPAVCIGPVTAAAARALGFRVVEAASPDPTAVAEAAAELVSGPPAEAAR